MKSNIKWNKCSTADCQQLFASSAERLRWLCFTLTADEDLADKAFESARELSMKSASQVFQQWMSSWARRQIIKSCIAVMRPTFLRVADCSCSCHRMELVSAGAIQGDTLPDLSAEDLQSSLLRLDVLSRFVFVLRALEGYSRRDTALLLNIGDADCESLYSQATNALHRDGRPFESAGKVSQISTKKDQAHTEYSVVGVESFWGSEQLCAAG
jgi:DNA-directed RNA polymerase specialized sigma24 family protein